MPVDNELYNREGDIWWDEHEVLNTLHTVLNPGRMGYMKFVLLEQLHLDPQRKHVLDVGCGGGILAEEFARLGCSVTGVDPSAASLATAQAHAARSGLTITYLQAFGEALPFPDESFDIVYCCDVLEHVNDVEQTISEIARVLHNDGIFFYDTINRTLISNLLTIKVLQEWSLTRVMPSNLHDWHMFIKPRELQQMLARQGFVNQQTLGLVPRMHPLLILYLLLRYKRGTITLKALGERMGIKRSNDIQNLYTGYAIKQTYV